MKDNIESTNKVENFAAIQKTAATIVDLADNSDVEYAKQIKLALEKRFPGIKSFAPSMSEIVVARYLTNHKMLEDVIENTSGNIQIVEMGSGFTPHSLNLGNKALKYIEIDLPENINIKKEIIGEINPSDNTEYVSGSVLDSEVWNKVTEIIDTNIPIIMFSEGLILYLNKEQQDLLAALVLPIIPADSVSKFVFDDSLKYHPDLQNNPALLQGRKNIIDTSKNTNVEETFSEEIVVDNCKTRGFSNVKRTPYVISGDKLKEVIGQYKLFECYK